MFTVGHLKVACVNTEFELDSPTELTSFVSEQLSSHCETGDCFSFCLENYCTVLGKEPCVENEAAECASVQFGCLSSDDASEVIC